MLNFADAAAQFVRPRCSISGDVFNYNKANPCISISKKANNTSLDFCWTNFNGECTSRIQNDGKNTKISEWYVKRSWEKEVRGDEYWGT